MRAVVTIAVAAMLLCAADGGAQESPLSAIGDAAVREEIRAVIGSAQRKGVPQEPLYSKVREGIAKQSSANRIRDAVRLLAERLEKAHSALTPAQSVDELTAAAVALQAGVPEATLRGMRKAWPDRPLTVALGVLAELVAHGVPAKHAAEQVRELMQRGASSAQIVALGDTVRSDIAAGRAPDASMNLRSKNILSLLSSPGASATLETRSGGDPAGLRPPPVRPPPRRN